MKKEWQAVYDMVTGTNTSGFGYDSVNRCGMVESPDVWASYCAVHKGADKWLKRALPYFEDLSIIFGKDRAQGSRAQDCVEMEHDANVEEELQQMEDDLNLNDLFEVSQDAPTTNVQSEECSSARKRKRKSRVDPFIEGISKAAELLGNKLDSASAALSQSLNAEVELQKKTSMVSAEIAKISFMSVRDKFKASRKIMHESEAVLTFWNLEGEERETFVMLMLEE